MSDELLPCPHCGSDKALVIGMADTPLNCYRWHVECQECHCTGRHFHRDEGARREMAVAAWNRRVPSDTVASVPVEVREALQGAILSTRLVTTVAPKSERETIWAALDKAQGWLDSQRPQPGREE